MSIRKNLPLPYSKLAVALLFFVFVEVVTFSYGQSSANTSLAAVATTPAQTVGSIAACATNASVTVGVPTSFMAVPRDANGVIIPGTQVTWSIGSESLATVSDTGVVTGLKPGVTSLAASYGSVVDRICLVVAAKK